MYNTNKEEKEKQNKCINLYEKLGKKVFPFFVDENTHTAIKVDLKKNLDMFFFFYIYIILYIICLNLVSRHVQVLAITRTKKKKKIYSLVQTTFLCY